MTKEPMIFRASRFGFLATLLLLPLAGSAAPSKSTNAAAPQQIQSVFVMPKSPSEGCDPFFPKATSLYQTETHVVQAAPVSFEALKLTGLMGSSLANINGKTFAIGETQEVKTTSGTLTVRLVQIKAQDDSVVVEANGVRHELKVGGHGGLTGTP